MKQGCCFSW